MLTLYIADYASVPRILCSPPSWMVHLALAEKGIAHRVVRLRYDAGAHRTPQMLALNPRGTIPVLTDGDIAVHETLAILNYVEFVHPMPSLLPPDNAGRARALTRLHEAEILKTHGMRLFAATMRDAPDLAAIASPFLAELARWDGYLAGQTWVGGERLGLADLAVFAYVACAAQLGQSMEAWPNLAAFMVRMRRRSAVRVTWPETWTGAPPSRPPWAAAPLS